MRKVLAPVGRPKPEEKGSLRFCCCCCLWVVTRLLNSDAKGGIKKEPNAQSLGQENPLFLFGATRQPPGARRE